ncbi:MAG: hypothetical protein LBT53_10290 [Puniceicoccales bacterium]|jgi:hypothetical protein|nr:hypothetical protein [Puniceicoccales bacterium]
MNPENPNNAPPTNLEDKSFPIFNPEKIGKYIREKLGFRAALAENYTQTDIAFLFQFIGFSESEGRFSKYLEYDLETMSKFGTILDNATQEEKRKLPNGIYPTQWKQFRKNDLHIPIQNSSFCNEFLKHLWLTKNPKKERAENYQKMLNRLNSSDVLDQQGIPETIKKIKAEPLQTVQDFLNYFLDVQKEISKESWETDLAKKQWKTWLFEAFYLIELHVAIEDKTTSFEPSLHGAGAEAKPKLWGELKGTIKEIRKNRWLQYFEEFGDRTEAYEEWQKDIQEFIDNIDETPRERERFEDRLKALVKKFKDDSKAVANLPGGDKNTQDKNTIDKLLEEVKEAQNTLRFISKISRSDVAKMAFQNRVAQLGIDVKEVEIRWKQLDETKDFEKDFGALETAQGKLKANVKNLSEHLRFRYEMPTEGFPESEKKTKDEQTEEKLVRKIKTATNSLEEKQTRMDDAFKRVNAEMKPSKFKTEPTSSCLKSFANFRLDELGYNFSPICPWGIPLGFVYVSNLLAPEKQSLIFDIITEITSQYWKDCFFNCVIEEIQSGKDRDKAILESFKKNTRWIAPFYEMRKLKKFELSFTIGENRLKIYYPQRLPENLQKELNNEYPNPVNTHSPADFPENEYLTGQFGIGELKHYIWEVRERISNLSTAFRQKSIESAKTAIMARNGSHNLGSHVMAYLKSELTSVETILEKNVLRELLVTTAWDSLEKNLSNVAETIKRLDSIKEVTETLELPVLVGLGRFITYLQERQDYIATVSTNYIPPNGTIAFKDAIYDEINMDWRWERHGNGSNQQSLRGRKPENILMKFIAYSEGYTKKPKQKSSARVALKANDDSLVIKFGNFDGSPISKVIEEKKEDGKNDFKRLRNLEIAIPGSIIGRQAFFSIIENIIRNAAKHSIKGPEAKLEIVMDVLTVDELAQNNFIGREIGKYKKYSWKYHIFSITNKLRNNFAAIDKIYDGINDDYINEDGHMKDDYKGIKEMRISAAWLRSFKIDSDIPTDEPPALCVLPADYKTENGVETCAIQYILCLPKPKKVALVLSDESYKKCAGNFPEKLEFFREYGWRAVKKSDFGGENANYEMVVAENATVRAAIEANAPSRLINWEEVPHDLSAETHYAKIVKGGKVSVIQLFNSSLSDKQNTDLPAKNETIPSVMRQDNLADGIAEILNSTNSKETLSRYEELFYKTWCNKIVQTPKRAHFPKLLIHDDLTADLKTKEYKNQNKDLQNEDVKIELNAASAALPRCGFAGNINFTTHYQGRAMDDARGGERKTALFAESISGADSSDRYIRYNTWTPTWYYKTIAASLARVAIFDERLFNDFHATPHTSDNNSGEPKFQIAKAQRLYEKRVWFYNFDFPMSGKKIALLGYNLPIVEDLSAFEPAKKANYKITTLGHITRNNAGKFSFEPQEGMNLKNKFDFLVIHQGLLDKIYEFFGIKGETEQKAKKQKEEFIRDFHRQFSATPTDAHQSYLPNLIIHSGRSKPSEMDMPFKQPFLQFAAIENAVKDCKHLLMELLFSSHYENDHRHN